MFRIQPISATGARGRVSRLLCAGLLLALCVGRATTASAVVASSISYQGELTDDAGVPLDGTVALRFKIFSTPTGGANFWTEDHAAVTVEDGLFHVLLGSITPFPPTVFDSATRYLETSVDGTALTPRRQFSAVPYAIHAATADVALSAPDGLWDESGGSVYRPTGNVGIGVTNPTRRLYIQGTDLGIADALLGNEDVSVEDADAVLGLYSNSGGQYGSGISLGESDGTLTDRWELFRRTSGSGSGLEFRFYDGVASATKVKFTPAGKVGIGTDVPASELTVVGTAEAQQLKANASLGSAATPDVGGVYGDNVVYAWARVNGAGTLEASHGIASVTRLGTGWYRVVFRRSLPNALIPMVVAYSANDVVVARVASTSTDRCDIRLDLYVPGTGFQAVDYRFLLTLNGRP